MERFIDTKEFIDLMESFERHAKYHVRTGSMGLQREKKDSWPSKIYYTDGNANQAFINYLMGYSYAKNIYNI